MIIGLYIPDWTNASTYPYITPDDLPDPGPEGPGVPGDERPRCPICTLGHHVQSCPEVRALLFAPAICSGCGDAAGADPCPACREWGVDPYGISLELRASIKTTAGQRVEYAPF